MGRPIDADALVRILESCRDTAPVLGLQSIIAVDDALQMVIDAPTIPAIPVEWLKAQIRSYTGDVSDIGKSAHNGTIKDLIRKWQREQEAR